MQKSDGSHRNYNKETENIDCSLRKSAARWAFMTEKEKGKKKKL